MIRLLDRDIAAADVIAELVEPSRLLTHHLLDPVRFHQAAVANIHRQLHNLVVYTPKAANAKPHDIASARGNDRRLVIPNTRQDLATFKKCCSEGTIGRSLTSVRDDEKARLNWPERTKMTW